MPEWPRRDEPGTGAAADLHSTPRWEPAEQRDSDQDDFRQRWRNGGTRLDPSPGDAEALSTYPAPGPLQEPRREREVENWRDQAYTTENVPIRYRWLKALCIGVLLGTLGAQASYIYREPITRSWPQLRPLYLSACAQLGCEIPLPKRIDDIVIERSNLEFSAPGSAHYELQAVIGNRAEHPQEVPHIELTLTDLGDQPLVRRALTPAEWLPKDFNREQGIEAGTRVAFTLPFAARDLKGVTGFRVTAFYP